MSGHKRTPANKKSSNVWQNEKTRRYHWEVRLVRDDGSEFRKAGSKSTEKDALAARDRAYETFSVNEGKAANHTVRSWCEFCLAEIWPNYLAHSTQSNYRHWLTTRVFPVLGAVRLDKLRVDQLQMFFNRLQEDDESSAAARTKTSLASALTSAVQNGILTSNPCRATKLRGDKREVIDEDEVPAKRILTMQEIDRLIAIADEENHPMLLPILLGGKLGLRFGECTGLDWRNVDLNEGVVRVRQQRQNVRGIGLSVVPLKTKASFRTVPVPASATAILARAREIAIAEGRRAVCVRQDGKAYSPQNGGVTLKEFFMKIEGFDGKNGLPIPTHHCLRSACLTFLANHANNGAGVRPSILMRIAGHSKLQTTMSFYIKPDKEDLVMAMATIP